MTEHVFCVGAGTAACQEGSSIRQYSSTGTFASESGRRMSQYSLSVLCHFCRNSPVIVAGTSMYITKSGSTVAEQLEVSSMQRTCATCTVLNS